MFTKNQEDEVLECMCKEIGLVMEYYPSDHYHHPNHQYIYDTILTIDQAPGKIDECAIIFRCLRSNIFSCNPINANIKYIFAHFGKSFEGSDTHNLFRSILGEKEQNH